MLATLSQDPLVIEAIKNPVVKAAWEDVLENGLEAGLQYIVDEACRPVIHAVAVKMGMEEEFAELLELAQDEDEDTEAEVVD